VLAWRAWNLDWQRPPAALADEEREYAGQMKFFDSHDSKAIVRLRALVKGIQWPPLSAFEAECHAEEPKEHTVPTLGCTCGVWSFRSLRQAIVTIEHASHLHALGGVDHPDVAVVGAVALWGRMVVCTQGYRAQYAYPRSLYVLEKSFYFRDFHKKGHAEAAAARLSRDYNVPAEVVTWEQLWNLSILDRDVPRETVAPTN